MSTDIVTCLQEYSLVSIIEGSNVPIAKRCIFCGLKPSDKNKEHVIPRWLIALTGDPKRTWHLGVQFNLQGTPARRFSADQFQFPACEGCNLRYSNLEGRAKSNIMRLLEKEALSATAWDDLLDWFDKVRVGLWLGNMILNKDMPTPTPNFYIDQRIGSKDRCILVYPLEKDRVGLQMVGSGDPVFFFTPTCFALAINHLLFLNISSDFLLACRMGFPFPHKMANLGSQIRANDCTAHFRMKSPVIRFSFFSPSIAVYQTILRSELFLDHKYATLTNSEYVQERLLPGNSTKTKICSLQDGKPAFLNPDEKVLHRELRGSERKSIDEYCVRLFEFRRLGLQDMLKTGEIEQPARELIRLMNKFNDYALAQTKSEAYRLGSEPM